MNIECPYCNVRFVSFDKQPGDGYFYNMGEETISNEHYSYSIASYTCKNPDCQKVLVALKTYNQTTFTGASRWIKPRQSYRNISPLVPTELVNDFNESCAVLNDSPKASAALSRRCLQHLLSLNGYEQRDLNKQIDAVRPHIPSYIATNLDYVREIGNFSAHPIKATNTGEIQDVEPGEAELNLDVLEELFDFFYVAPAKAKIIKDKFDQKILEAGRKPL